MNEKDIVVCNTRYDDDDDVHAVQDEAMFNV
jgi:hypothetical protein